MDKYIQLLKEEIKKCNKELTAIKKAVNSLSESSYYESISTWKGIRRGLYKALAVYVAQV